MSPLLPRFKCMSVRQKILVIFLSLSLISLLIMGIIAFFTIYDIGIYAKDSSHDLGETAKNGSMRALESQAMYNMDQIAADQAEMTNIIFEDTDSEMEILAGQAVSLQRNAPLSPLVPSFTRSPPPFNSGMGPFPFLPPTPRFRRGPMRIRTFPG